MAFFGLKTGDWSRTHAQPYLEPGEQLIYAWRANTEPFGLRWAVILSFIPYVGELFDYAFIFLRKFYLVAVTDRRVLLVPLSWWLRRIKKNAQPRHIAREEISQFKRGGFGTMMTLHLASAERLTLRFNLGRRKQVGEFSAALTTLTGKQEG